MVKNVNFRKVPNTFQNQCKTYIKKNIKNKTRVYMKADKTTNYYKVEVEKAEELVKNKVHKIQESHTKSSSRNKLDGVGPVDNRPSTD